MEERACIYQFLNLGMSIRKIAQALKRSPSTISREIKRNSSKIKVSRGSYTKYFPVKANDKYIDRRKDCHRKSNISKDVIEYLTIKINEHWSPEQISNRRTSVIHEMPSTSTIYRLIRAKKVPKTSMENLRRKGKFKRPAEKRGKFNDKGRTIKKRPKEIYKRQEIGHWEGDTVESGRNDHKRKSGYCFVTLAERKSRYYIAILVENRKSENVTLAIINALKDFPKALVKTITFDRGKEFSGFEKIEKELGCKTYFCDPYCAWQKGTNENSNGLLREFYPKGMDLSEVDIDDLNHNLNLMNNRPRKCIKYATI
ncbi:IS30 family transposase [Peptostreptococcus anaerobius]|uniref:IS30 family transposase n=1 Tax=Peptostreptococcus anaerobius TaxID=1261 RepID=UPI002900BF7F|nr:IS30 family transposase [Peptostreptococcus anaerobius]MDU1234290.1 IS30 family transposase [Peptostreptococcus anaerobius]